MGGRRLSGIEAVEWGIANEAVPREGFAARLTETEDRLLRGAVGAYGPTKRLLRRDVTDGYEAHLREEIAAISELSGGPESVALVDGFADRR